MAVNSATVELQISDSWAHHSTPQAGITKAAEADFLKRSTEPSVYTLTRLL